MKSQKPSRTALKVAFSLLTLSEKPGMEAVLPPGIVEATEQLLLLSGAASATSLRWARSQRMLTVYRAFDRILPGQFEAFGHRKAFCERQAREGIKAGAAQVLVLGAGYDTLGWRLAPEFPDVNFFEIDHPATARLKSRGIAAMGHRDNLHLLEEDLGSKKLRDVLNANDLWDGNARTVITAEGLVMYLPREAVRELFCQCASITAAGSRVVFTYIPTGEDGRPCVGRWTGLMLWLQKVAGEPWIWSIRPEELDSFLRETGWTNAPELAGVPEKRGVEYFAVATS
jgi:methyltransferase (TIGR00027 family)